MHPLPSLRDTKEPTSAKPGNSGDPAINAALATNRSKIRVPLVPLRGVVCIMGRHYNTVVTAHGIFWGSIVQVREYAD